MRIESPKDLAAIAQLESELHAGEAEAIVLAREQSAGLSHR